jgi:glycosidase
LPEGSAIPDPEGVETYEHAVLSWKVDEDLLSWYRDLIQLRKMRPALQGRARDTMVVHPARGSVLMLERKILNDRVVIFLNFGAEAYRVADLTGEPLRVVFGSPDVSELEPWSVMVCESIEDK